MNANPPSPDPGEPVESVAPPAPGELTMLFQVAGEDAAAANRCLAAVYDELRRMAQRQLGWHARDHTLQPTALVHEAYLKLLGPGFDDLRGRGHFFALAARAMRQILIDHARTKRRLKRGGAESRREPLDDVVASYEASVGDLEALERALAALAERDERAARLVEMRFFTQLPMPEVAALLDIPLRTAERQWTMARAFIRAEMERAEGA